MSPQSHAITVIIGGKTRRLKPGDPDTFSDLSPEEADHLIALLESLKLQREESCQRVEGILQRQAQGIAQAHREAASHKGSVAGLKAEALDVKPGSDRLGKGDIDQLMVRLAQEESQRTRSRVKPATIYKVAAIVIIVIILLSIF